MKTIKKDECFYSVSNAIRTLAMERLMGVEPTYAAWEAAVLPMNYSRGPGVYDTTPDRKMQGEN